MRLLLYVMVFLLMALNVTAQRFVKSANTIAQLVTLNVNDVHTNVFVANYATQNDGGGGLFVYDANSSATTNLGTVFKPTSYNGRWLRSYSGPLNVKWFGAKCDASTDDTTSITNAITALGNSGGTVYIPGRSKFNITITANNITLQGDGGVKDYAASPPTTGWWMPYTITTALIQVGNDSGVVRGFTIKDASLYGHNGTAPGNVGIYYAGGAYETYAYNVTSYKFKTNLLFRAGSTYPSSLHRWIGFTLESSTNTNARCIMAIMPNNQASYTTAMYFYGGHINAPTNSGSYAAEFDGTDFQTFTDCYIDGITLTNGVRLSKSGSGQLEPHIGFNGTTLDGGGAVPVISVYETPAPQYMYDRIYGWLDTTGKIIYGDGTSVDIKTGVNTDMALWNANVFQKLLFARDGTNAVSTYEYIQALSTGLLQLNSAVGITNNGPFSVRDNLLVFSNITASGTIVTSGTNGLGADGVLMTLGRIGTTGKIYTGDGTGYTVSFAKRSGGTDTAYLDIAELIGVGLKHSVLFASPISPSQITSQQDNYNPSGISTANVLRLSTDASRDITGIQTYAGMDGRALTIHNIGAQNIVLKDASASSNTTNRFEFDGDKTIAGDKSIMLFYDGTTARWRAIGL